MSRDKLRSFMGKLGLVISYVLSILYILSIVMPAYYCWEHSCHGPDLDGFMPAFMLIPLGGLASVHALQNAVGHIKKKDGWSWLFWVLAVIFSAVLAGTVGFIALLIYMVSTHH